VIRPELARTFWCTWWTEDPRRNTSALPDDYGFVEGSRTTDAAVGAAYDSLRKGRGRAIFDICVGEALTAKAYRAGAPVRRAAGKDFDAIAMAGFAALGLEPDASVAAVKAAYRREAKRLHPDHGGDAAAFRDLHAQYEAALAEAKRREEVAFLADIAAGKAPPAPKRKKPRKEAPGEQGCL